MLLIDEALIWNPLVNSDTDKLETFTPWAYRKIGRRHGYITEHNWLCFNWGKIVLLQLEGFLLGIRKPWLLS